MICYKKLNPAICMLSCTLSCTLSCECIQQLVHHFRVLGYFFHDILCHVQHAHPRTTSFHVSRVLPTIAVDSQLQRIDLPSVILPNSLFRSKVVIKHCQKNVFIRWLLTPFKSAKKNGNTPYALRTHFTQAYRRLDTLPITIINSWYQAFTNL